MDILMLGTGSAFAKTFYNNNALVYSEGRTLLIDCGHTAPRALHRLGIPLTDIDAILVTHIHADHVGGLEELAFQYSLIYKTRKPLYVADTLVSPLWEHTLRGGLQQEDNHSLEDYFDVRPLREGEAAELLPGLTAELLRTEHIPGKKSYSVLLNGTFFYTADMKFDPDLLRRLVYERGVKTIFHDCQLHAPGTVHACLPELLTLPEDLQERIRLMHYGDDQPNFIGRSGKMTFVEQHKRYTI
jgi:ribonuclease BN (tRNA processing enzyme)